MSPFDDLTGKTEVIGLSGLMTLTDAKSIQCSQKRKKLIENQFSRANVIQNSID
jgi:hypothetical protein